MLGIWWHLFLSLKSCPGDVCWTTNAEGGSLSGYEIIKVSGVSVFRLKLCVWLPLTLKSPKGLMCVELLIVFKRKGFCWSRGFKKPAVFVCRCVLVVRWQGIVSIVPIVKRLPHSPPAGLKLPPPHCSPCGNLHCITVTVWLWRYSFKTVLCAFFL